MVARKRDRKFPRERRQLGVTPYGIKERILIVEEEEIVKQKGEKTLICEVAPENGKGRASLIIWNIDLRPTKKLQP